MDTVNLDELAGRGWEDAGFANWGDGICGEPFTAGAIGGRACRVCGEAQFFRSLAG